MNDRGHIHVSMMTDPIDDAELIINLSRSPNKRSNCPHMSTISNCENLEITNDNNITLGKVSSERLKSLSRNVNRKGHYAHT